MKNHSPSWLYVKRCAVSLIVFCHASGVSYRSKVQAFTRVFRPERFKRLIAFLILLHLQFSSDSM
jgi:hypothetical protein